MTMNFEALIEKLENRFVAENAAGVDAVIQFSLTGEQQGEWYLQIKDQQCNMIAGTHNNPALSVSADEQDLREVLAGDLTLMKAFMSGAVQVRGDIGLAMKLMELFRRE